MFLPDPLMYYLVEPVSSTISSPACRFTRSFCAAPLISQHLVTTRPPAALRRLRSPLVRLVEMGFSGSSWLASANGEASRLRRTGWLRHVVRVGVEAFGGAGGGGGVLLAGLGAGRLQVCMSVSSFLTVTRAVWSVHGLMEHRRLILSSLMTLALSRRAYSLTDVGFLDLRLWWPSAQGSSST